MYVANICSFNIQKVRVIQIAKWSYSTKGHVRRDILFKKYENILKSISGNSGKFFREIKLNLYSAKNVIKKYTANVLSKMKRFHSVAQELISFE